MNDMYSGLKSVIQDMDVVGRKEKNAVVVFQEAKKNSNQPVALNFSCSTPLQ
jgi:hypothetical protein